MHRITVPGLPGTGESAANARHGTDGTALRHAGDELPARLLITSWTLAVGRTLRAGMTPQLSSQDELISFRGADQLTAAAPAAAAAAGTAQ
jgi:hypothetical protein